MLTIKKIRVKYIELICLKAIYILTIWKDQSSSFVLFGEYLE